jgi:hypothetical protein
MLHAYRKAKNITEKTIIRPYHEHVASMEKIMNIKFYLGNLNVRKWPLPTTEAKRENNITRVTKQVACRSYMRKAYKVLVGV